MAIIKAPFTEDEVYNLNKWQADGRVHPFTCGTKGKHKPGDDDVLIAVSIGWVCPSCDYKQDWAHDFMALPSNQMGELVGAFPEFPEMSGEEAREYLKKEGYDPDELVKHGITFVRMASLLARIKLAAYEEVTPLEKIVKIKGLIQQYEKEMQDEDSSLHNEGEAVDNDV